MANKQLEEAGEWVSAFRTAVRDSLDELGLDPTPTSTEMGFNRSYLKQFLESETMTPSLARVIIISRRLNIDVNKYLPKELIPDARDYQTARVTQYVQAGFVDTSSEWPEDMWYDVYIPPELTGKIYAAEVRGPSMNKVFPEKTIIFFNDWQETGEPLVNGEQYVYLKADVHGQREYCVKTLEVDSSGIEWFVAETDDPSPTYKIKIPASPSGQDPGETIQIIGRVVGEYRRRRAYR